MRLDPFGLTGPPTSRKRRGAKKKREEEKEQQQLCSSSSSSSSTSFAECVRFVRDRVVDNGARRYDGPDNEEAGTATAFRVPRNSASRGVVRARTRDRHEDHEDENDYDGDADVGVVLVDRPSPRRRAPRCSARRARGRARRRRERGPIPEEGPDVATSAVSFVDVLAYTAYSDDRDDDDDDDDDDGDDERRARCRRKRIHGGPEEDHDKHAKNGNDDEDDDARVSVPDNEQGPRVAKEDYIRAKVDAINRGVPKGDHQWASPSSSLDEREDRRYERIDNYSCATVDEEFDGHERGKGRGWRRSDNTAWFQKPIIRRRGEGGRIGEKPRTRRSYYKLLLFMLYLLTWPLLCSTSPSGHFTSTFTQNPTLAHIKNPAQRGNASPLETSYSSSTVIVQHQHQQPQQYVQSSDYNTDSERHRHHQQQQQEVQQLQRKERKEKREQKSNREEEPRSRIPDNIVYTWEVNQLNPWLSACDLAGPAPADLQGSCGPPEVPKYCPMPCKNENEMRTTTTTTTTMTRTRVGNGVGEEKKKEEGVRTAREQCLLYLEESHKGKICRNDSVRSTSNFSLRKDRYRYLSRLRLRHCCEQAVVNALAPGKDGLLEDVLNGGGKCADALDKLLIVDALAARLHCEFEEVLARYDCAQPYSVIHNCTDCKEAYRKWVCSSLVPYFAHGGPMDAETPGGSWTGTRLRPCRSFCQTVEQRCPYLLPGDRAPAYPTQYAGEPTFLCRDPNIPEIGEHAARALHNTDGSECCFHVCAKDASISGICTNCEEPWKHVRLQDPWTAPQCDTAALQSGPTGQYSGSQPEASTERGPADDGQETSTASSSSSTPTSSSTTTAGKQETLFCGSGRIGSIPSASSPGRSSPPIVLQLLWLYSILISLPANALQYNLLASTFWSPFGLFRLIGSGLPGVFVLRRTLNDLRVSAFGSRSAGMFYRHASIVRCLLFILWMPRRAVTKCRRRGWWWWRSWRRSSSRHFRWKLPRRGGVASWRSILRDASTAILVLFLKFAAKCRCRRDDDWWWWCWCWLWRRWRECGSTRHSGQDPGLFFVRGKRFTMAVQHGTRRRGRRRGRGPSGVLETDVASSAKATSRKDPP